MKMFTLNDICKSASDLPDRIFLYGPEGWGKTTFAAKSNKPLFLMCKGETGLATLVKHGRLEETDYFPPCVEWEQLIGILNMLLKESKLEHETLVLDTANSAEDLCAEYICKRDFKGDWSDSGFSAYSRGYDIVQKEWQILLDLLDKVQNKHFLQIIMLAHTTTKLFANPEGADYDRIGPSLEKRVWARTHKWADMILYGGWDDRIKLSAGRGGVADPDKKGKAIKDAGRNRIIYTVRTVLFDAKNRAGLEPKFMLPNDPDESWATFKEKLNEAQERNRASRNGEISKPKAPVSLMG